MLKVITFARCLKKIYSCLNDTVSLHSFSVGACWGNREVGTAWELTGIFEYYAENYGCVELLDFAQV